MATPGALTIIVKIMRLNTPHNLPLAQSLREGQNRHAGFNIINPSETAPRAVEGAGQVVEGAGHVAAFRSALKAGAITVLVAAVVVIATGDIQGKLFTQHYQPMKMAAAEALYHTARPAPLSLFTIGSLNGSHAIFTLELPQVLSFLGTGNWSGRVQSIDDLQRQYARQYGPGSYTPVIPVTYWSFRVMIGAGLLAAVIVAPLLPLAANAFGWIMTEMGRQPWLVYGQMKTAAGVSANSGGEVLTSLTVFTLLYGTLAVIEAGLMLSAIKAGPPGEDKPLELIY
jgi:cytochrome d ubiquinol oxidase subunit I